MHLPRSGWTSRPCRRGRRWDGRGVGRICLSGGQLCQSQYDDMASYTWVALLGILQYRSAFYYMNGCVVQFTIGEDNTQLEQSSLPQGLLLAWYATFPYLQIKHTSLRITLGLCVETEGMITSPLLPLLLEAHLTQSHVVLLRVVLSVSRLVKRLS